MAMGANTCTFTTTRYEPNWARHVPTVPTYPNPPAFFRRTSADKYTNRGDTYDNYYRKSRPWNCEYPEWREEYYRLDPMAPVERKINYQLGPTTAAFQRTTEKPRPDWHPIGSTVGEAKRIFGINRMNHTVSQDNLYQFSNAMTSTQYKKPVANIYGPLKRERVYGVKHQHNRHGFMPFDDYYF